MATIVLSAAGMALGSAMGGSVLGLSAATIGRATGAVMGRLIDDKLLGAGSAPVETGKVDRFRLTGASEGAPLAQVYGRMRVSGQVIWASKFRESANTTGSGKGTSVSASSTEYSYSVSVAIALCVGQITRVGRVWADGVEIATDELNLRVYLGDETQQPDPKMEAVEGAGMVPAYRGMAYVVFEDLPLGRFGNRVPQFSFEVFRPAAERLPAEAEDIAHLLRGVALIPGTGEYALATTPVFLSAAYGEQVSVNLNSPSGKTDMLTSLEALTGELPNVASTVLVVSWFGDDLRCANCEIRPKIEQNEADAAVMPWQVCGLNRTTAQLVPRVEGRPVYGGTPSDQSVMEAITALREAGQDVVYYPFILMDQLVGNPLVDPWTASAGQPPLPWRGRITLSAAPGQAGSPDRTAVADAEVATFFGMAQVADFIQTETGVDYTGPDEWSLRRFILHQAHLCAAAGGVGAFCIGSEMRGLTQIRGAGDSFPAVAALRTLAADCRAILGPNCKIGYAADWSEYHGYQPTGTGDKYFHLDPLWADPVIDFVGIDNYMPLSDWRDGEYHLDASAGSIYNLDYLTANVAGGEGFDWFYHSPEALAAQIRTPIEDYFGEEWVWRYKDIKGWWENPHHNRVNGERVATPTAWQSKSKPIWFTELGCAAIDKGTNEPNKFLDPKSSESLLPRQSNGLRDDFIQMQYLRAIHRHFADPVANPISDVYGGPMVDMARAHVWAWDARPYPNFPLNTKLWSDGANYARGHWINGRTSSRSLASVVLEICAWAGVTEIDTSRLYGVVRGYQTDDTDTARSALQVLMVAFAFDAIERDGVLEFRSRNGKPDARIGCERLVYEGQGAATLELTRAPSAEVVGTARVGFVDADGDYEMRAAEAIFPDDALASVNQSELPIALTIGEGRQIAERWLAEARVARDTVRFGLPPSAQFYGAGDVLEIEANGHQDLWRIDRVETTTYQAIDAVRVEPEVYRPHESPDDVVRTKPFVAPVPIEAIFLDLPLLTGEEVPHAPHVAMTSNPWPGQGALYAAPQHNGYIINRILPVAATIGTTETVLEASASGRWDRGAALKVKLVKGSLRSVSQGEVLSGLNLAAIGDGVSDIWEVLQFANATLVGPDTYDISIRLRGQAGTDGVMPSEWPVGSRFVLLDGVPGQIQMAGSLRDITQHFRWGPAQKPIDDATYRHRETAFRGIGLRPYAVCHLTAQGLVGGEIELKWIRRTRINGDSWTQSDVPLGETTERYEITVSVDGLIRRQLQVTTTSWIYSAAMQIADGAGAVVARVAQVSETFGPGPERAIVLSAS